MNNHTHTFDELDKTDHSTDSKESPQENKE
jgi:hypothetical protein